MRTSKSLLSGAVAIVISAVALLSTAGASPASATVNTGAKPPTSCTRIYYTGPAARPTSLQLWCNGQVINVVRDFRDRKTYQINKRYSSVTVRSALLVDGEARIFYTIAGQVLAKQGCVLIRTIARPGTPNQTPRGTSVIC